VHAGGARGAGSPKPSGCSAAVGARPPRRPPPVHIPEPKRSRPSLPSCSQLPLQPHCRAGPHCLGNRVAQTTQKALPGTGALPGTPQPTPQRTGMLEQAPCCSARITAPKQRTRKAVSALRVHGRAAWRGRTAWQAARLCAPSTATATSTDRPVHRACASRWLLPPQPHGRCCSARRRAAGAPPHPPPRQDGPATATDAGQLIRTGTNACRTGKGGRQPARQLPRRVRACRQPTLCAARAAAPAGDPAVLGVSRP